MDEFVACGRIHCKKVWVITANTVYLMFDIIQFLLTVSTQCQTNSVVNSAYLQNLNQLPTCFRFLYFPFKFFWIEFIHPERIQVIIKSLSWSRTKKNKHQTSLHEHFTHQSFTFTFTLFITKLTLTLDYEKSLTFLGDTKTSEQRDHARQLPRARRRNTRVFRVASLFARGNFRARSRDSLALL